MQQLLKNIIKLYLGFLLAAVTASTQHLFSPLTVTISKGFTNGEFKKGYGVTHWLHLSNMIGHYVKVRYKGLETNSSGTRMSLFILA